MVLKCVSEERGREGGEKKGEEGREWRGGRRKWTTRTHRLELCCWDSRVNGRHSKVGRQRASLIKRMTGAKKACKKGINVIVNTTHSQLTWIINEEWECLTSLRWKLKIV